MNLLLRVIHFKILLIDHYDWHILFYPMLRTKIHQMHSPSPTKGFETNCPNVMLRSKNLESQWVIDSTKEPMGFKANDNATPVGRSLSRSTEAGQATRLIVPVMFLLHHLLSQRKHNRVTEFNISLLTSVATFKFHPNSSKILFVLHLKELSRSDIWTVSFDVM